MYMNRLLHPFTSVGSLTKKIMAINPDLSVQEIIALIRHATRSSTQVGTGSSSGEIIDEARALELAKATLYQGKETQ